MRSLEKHLQAAPDAARVIQHAQLLIQLGRLYEAAVPGSLASVSHVANFKSGKVVIHADSGVVAAKIKQLSGRLAGELSKRGVECSGIEVRVQPPANRPPAAVKSQRPLSAKAAISLEIAAKSMPTGSVLRAALDDLLARSAR